MVKCFECKKPIVGHGHGTILSTNPKDRICDQCQEDREIPRRMALQFIHKTNGGQDVK